MPTVGQIEGADSAEEKDEKHTKEMYPFNQSAVFLMQARSEVFSTPELSSVRGQKNPMAARLRRGE